MGLLETHSNVATCGHAVDLDAIVSATGQVIAPVDTDKEVFPDLIVGADTEHDAGDQYRDGLRGRTDHMEAKTGGNDPGSEAGTLEKFDLGCRGQGELTDIHAGPWGRKRITGYLAAEFLVVVVANLDSVMNVAFLEMQDIVCLCSNRKRERLFDRCAPGNKHRESLLALRFHNALDFHNLKAGILNLK